MIEKRNQGGKGGGGQIYDLVTEEVNGIARAFDKRVLDHSLHNVAQMGMCQNEQEAIAKLTSVDDQYREEYGQYIGWRDAQANPILSRCSYSPIWTLPSSETWVDAVYDDQHGTICVLCVGTEGRYPGEEGDFLVATRKIRGPWEKRNVTFYERWICLAYGNGIIVALTGNSSSEFAISHDGGFTWDFNRFSSSYEALKCRFIDGLFYVVTKFGYFTTEDFVTFSQYNNVTGLLDVCKDGGGICLLTYRSQKYYVDRSVYGGTSSVIYDNSQTSKISLDEIYYFRDGWFMATSRGGYREEGSSSRPYTAIFHDNGNGTVSINTGASVNVSEGETLVQAIPYIRNNYFQNRELQFFVSSYKDGNVTIRYNTYDTVSGFSTHPVWSERTGDVQPTYLLPCNVKPEDMASGGETNLIFSFSGGVLKYGGVKSASSYGYMETVMSTDIGYDYIEYSPANKWERIPLPNEFQNGIIAVHDREVKEVTVKDPYLEYDREDVTLKANASDRITDYENYRLVSLSTEAEYQEIFCIVPRANIVDGSTKVYSDEACTVEVGVIQEHDYNINNPNDTRVLIDGASWVYSFQDSKTPVSLATTKAVIDAMGQGGVVITDDNDPLTEGDDILGQRQNAQGNEDVKRFGMWNVASYIRKDIGLIDFYIYDPNNNDSRLILVAEVSSSNNRARQLNGLVYYNISSENVVDGCLQKIYVSWNHGSYSVKTDLLAQDGEILPIKPCIVQYQNKYYIALQQIGKHSNIYFLGRQTLDLSAHITPTALYYNSQTGKWYSDASRTSEVTVTFYAEPERFPANYLDFGGNSSQVVAGDGTFLNWGEKLGFWVGVTSALPPVGSRETNVLYITTDY